jgi:hypothetical protein
MLNLTPKSHKNSPLSMYNVKNFPGASPGPPFKGEGGRGGTGREGRERRGRELGEGSIPKIKFYDYSTSWA